METNRELVKKSPYRVNRGGSWLHHKDGLYYAAYHNWYTPEFQSYILGLRPVIILEYLNEDENKSS